ncbi:MAG TPA: hypothetical protein VKS79_19955 [Gemmataceae bacterium]|nr:hypothetical protein [Gemmataceae bacterium]
MSLIPNRFLFRVAYPCCYHNEMPREDEECLLDLPNACRIDNFAGMDNAKSFADVRLAWNELGIGIQVKVKGKEQPPAGDPNRPRGSDGLTLWLDTRGDRTSHRASRYCHQFHFLAAGGGSDKDEPLFLQSKIHRALQDAPFAEASEMPFRCELVKGGYRLEAFLSAAVLHGFDPAEHPKLGFYYAVRDQEQGEQTLSVGAEFPFAEDPSLWSVLELVRN